MNTKWIEKRRRSAKAPVRSIVMAVAMAVCMIALNSTAMAALEGSAGNTIIRNTVTVNYEDGGGTAQTAITAEIDVTVNTIDVQPSVVSFNPSPGSTDGTGDTETYAVVIRTNSNGPATITLGATDVGGSEVNITLDLANPASLTSGGSIFLGATVVDPTDGNGASNIAAGGSITFTVPNDGGLPTDMAVNGGAFNDGIINGLTDNDTVYLHDGTNHYGPFTVNPGSVVDPTVGAGTTAQTGSITLVNASGNPISITPTPGWMILEAQTDTLTVTQGLATDPTNTASWQTTVTADMNGNVGSGTVTTNATGAVLDVRKYVRNVTNDNGSGATQTVNINGTNLTFYDGGVSGDPGDTLEYALVVENDSLGSTQNVVATDPVPAYTTLSTWATGGYGNTSGADVFAAVDDSVDYVEVTVVNSDTESATLGAANASGTSAGSALTFYLGDGGTDASDTGGTLAGGETITVVYRVTID